MDFPGTSKTKQMATASVGAFLFMVQPLARLLEGAPRRNNVACVICGLQINTKQPAPLRIRETIAAYALPDTAPTVMLPSLLAVHAEARYLSSPPGRRLTLFGSQRLVMVGPIYPKQLDFHGDVTKHEPGP